MNPVTFLRLLAGGSPSWIPTVQGTWRQHAHLSAGRRHAASITAVGMALLCRAARLSSRWRQRTRRRGQLRDLSDHLLRDIGLRREHWFHKTSKPVWW
jgi:uncharacterized protein YjiS (DUF1127 family)